MNTENAPTVTRKCIQATSSTMERNIFATMIVCTLGIQKKNMTNFAKRTELTGLFGEFGGKEDKTKPINLTGQRFGRWTVIRETEQRQFKSIMWECQCDCGTVRLVNGANLRRGLTLSCGCYNNEKAAEHCKGMAKHDMHKSRIYRVWCGMKARCETPTAKNYKNYGGRGISVCNEWRNFEPFYEWAMANGYNENAPYGKCTLDRIDVNGDYSPDNCRWVDIKIQNNNKRKGDI